MQDGYDGAVTGHHPSVQNKVPMNGILSAQTTTKRVGIGQHLLNVQLAQAEPVIRFNGDGLTNETH
jgi:hypothetical protein